MEFLMSYGWAILVVLVVIGALAYFGVLSPQKLLPDKCTFPPGLVCEDYSLSTAGGVQMVLSNGMGKTISIADIEVIDAADPSAIVCAPGGLTPQTVANGARSSTITCGAGSTVLNVGSKQKLNVKITYKFGSDPASATALDHVAEGEIYATVQ